MDYITTHAWCMEHARPALGGAIPWLGVLAYPERGICLNDENNIFPAMRYIRTSMSGLFIS